MDRSSQPRNRMEQLATLPLTRRRREIARSGGRGPSRRGFIRSLCATLPVFSADQLLAGQGFGVQFVNVAKEAGLRAKTIFGGEHKNKYLLETTGCGCAFFDYDNDGWLDIFLVNGTRFEAQWPAGQAPVSRLYKNNRDGTFTDVTIEAGVAHTGWGQGVCAGDYNNDGWEDLFVTYWGDCVLWHNHGNGKFTNVAQKAGVTTNRGDGRRRWNTGCAFVDYDRDGHLDLFVANYIDFDPKTAPLPESGPCLYKGLMVACGPPGLEGGRNILFHNDGSGVFTDVSERAGILKTQGTYGLGVLVGDFDNDGWPDIYVANDSTSSALYKNNQDGTFTDVAIEAGVAFSPDGKPQAGMGVSAIDYDGDGWLDIVKTNFAGDTSSLYRNLGKMTFNDETFQAGLGRNTRFLGWGVGFADFDNDGWADIFICNGHVYPEVSETQTESGYRERKVVYRNLGNRKFADVSIEAGPGALEAAPGRGCAFGDFDNDGDVDVLVNCVNDVPQLLRCDRTTRHNWIKVKLTGVKSNRSGIGARVYCNTEDGRRQMDEVRSGGSYISQSDLRLHFGLGAAESAELVVQWPSGAVDRVRTQANRIVTVIEGTSQKA
ncbi:MAG TPA: CRTAC1 family protein [Bryobacteraceae bacterium]|nr:CRTAC1 family protein [Bryobacteraceae bacterium]